MFAVVVVDVDVVVVMVVVVVVVAVVVVVIDVVNTVVWIVVVGVVVAVVVVAVTVVLGRRRRFVIVVVLVVVAVVIVVVGLFPAALGGRRFQTFLLALKKAGCEKKWKQDVAFFKWAILRTYLIKDKPNQSHRAAHARRADEGQKLC